MFQPLLNTFILLTPVLCFIGLVAIVCSVLASWDNSLSLSRKFFLFLAFAFFGSTIGSIMGAAKATDTSAFITSIITFASGYLAYLVSKDLDENLKRLIPLSLVSFLVNILVSVFYMRYFFNQPTV